MRILVVGAGAIGGMVGGRLLEIGRDVTFLVRPRRARALAEGGLVIKSALGDFTSPNPPTVTSDRITAPFDVVMLSCKAYDLDDALESVAPAVGPQTTILPLLNGIRHIDVIAQKFGDEKVLGGLCGLSVTLDDAGHIVQLGSFNRATFGERDGSRSPRVLALADAFDGARFEGWLSETILQDMWEKWIFIATAAGINCLMRASIGDIVAAGGAPLAAALFNECAAVAAMQGFAPRDDFRERCLTMVTTAGSSLRASMLRDIERGGRTEGEHILGDLMRRGRLEGKSDSLLRAAQVHVAAYEARRARLAPSAAPA